MVQMVTLALKKITDSLICSEEYCRVFFLIFLGYIKHLSSTRKRKRHNKSKRTNVLATVCLRIRLKIYRRNNGGSVGSLQHINTLSLSSDILYVSKPRGKRKRLYVCVYTYCVLSLHPSINITFSQFVFCFCYAQLMLLSHCHNI